MQSENLTLNKASLMARVQTMPNDGVAANLLLHLTASENSGKLPNNDDFLHRASRVHLHDWLRLKPFALSGFTLVGGVWENAELITQITEQQRISAIRAMSAAKKSAKAKQKQERER